MAKAKSRPRKTDSPTEKILSVELSESELVLLIGMLWRLENELKPRWPTWRRTKATRATRTLDGRARQRLLELSDKLTKIGSDQ
jgi:hypothetical protein